MKKTLSMIIILLLLLSIYKVQAMGKKLYFIEKDNRIVYEKDEEDNTFMQHLDMLPGSNYVDELEIENGTKNSYTLYLKVEDVNQSLDAQELLDNINMKLYLDNVLIYDGKAKGLDYRNQGINLQDAVLLKEFKSNDKSLLKVETKLSEEYSNKNNTDLSKVNWVFYAQYENREPGVIDGVPKTAKNNYPILIIGLIVLLIGVLTVIYSGWKKKALVH